ncbi:hypothetical protein RRG08_054605 [Elysia crispata]|uniref:CST complex subunit CTC1 n=1 Tax=Elysia crispata TaxID=231223 RepID=A0AAE1B2Y9_9GAST|nr:hypothetical protein RRG08_054605 [Elysia crispata]
MEKDAFLLAHDVAELLANKSWRHSMHHRLKVSLKGTVTSLSGIVRLNSDSLFMMEVDSCVPILVKDFHLEWHSLLEPGGVYLFHGLIITTVEKGIWATQTVLLVWNESCLTKIDSCSDAATLPLSCWLKSLGITADLPDSSNWTESFWQDCSCDNFVNYEGQITSIHDAKDGFYTLDKKIRMYCNDLCLTVNSELYIFNAHLIKIGSTPYLVCCEKSLLREKKSFNKENTSSHMRENFDQAKQKKTSFGLTAIFRKCHLSLREMVTTVKIRDSFLALKRSNETVTQAMKALFFEKSLWNIPRRSERFLDKFLQHNCNCPHTSQNTMVNRIPEILSLSALKLGLYTEETENDQRIKITKKEYGYSEDYFSFHKICHEILVGKIIAGSRGQIYFSDGKEFLPLLILENPYDQEAQASLAFDYTDSTLHHSHTCKNVCVNDKKFGEYLPCPFLDSTLVNKIILLHADNFTDIIEFEIFGHIIKVKESSENFESDPLNSKESPYDDETYEKDFMNLSQYKGFPTSSEIVKKRNIPQSFYKRTHSTSVSVVFSGEASNCFHLINAGNLYILKTTQNLLDSSLSNDHLQKAAQSCSVHQQTKVTEIVRVKRLERTAPDTSKKRPEYSIIDILSEEFTGSMVSFLCQIQIRYISNSNFADRCKQTGCNSAFIMANTCLQVRDLLCDQAFQTRLLPIYIDSPRNVYSFGLVPGAVILFNCLERRVSQAGNVYCRFTTASSLKVLTILPVEHITTSNGQERSTKVPELSDLPEVLIADMWFLGSEYTTETPDGTMLLMRQGLYALECHICMFFQLIIKMVCSLCGGIFSSYRCQNKQCMDDVHPVLVIKAIILVDDGSSQATVSFHDANLVARLLTLTEEQWNDMSERFSDCGQLLISKNSTVPLLPVAELLSNLCSSPLVLRPCRLAVTLDKKSPTHHSINKKALDEFQITEVKIAKNSVHTCSLPLPSLDCFGLEEIS